MPPFPSFRFCLQGVSVVYRWFALFLGVVLLSACAEPPPYVNLDSAQVRAKMAQGTAVVDVRRADEWRETGVLPDSVLLTFVDGAGRLNPRFVDEFTRRFDKNDPVILICRTGNRTDALGRLLMEQLGYTQVYVAEHGISRWIRDGMPTVPARG
ncbi:MAG: rhodanese-like domain-containing protein [Chromatiales bacterium]|nr:rhodanese-like domain-containing protein [Chromatiales bacterium]